jgi:uncharacterized membrane protein
MSAGSPDNCWEAPIFSALLTPHRSLDANGFFILISSLGGISLTLGASLLLVGAWPIVGFCGFAVVMVYCAFRANYRAAMASEEVIVTRSELVVRKINPHGRVREWTLNPLWVRIDRGQHEEFGVRQIVLVSSGRRLPIAGFLGPNEKARVASALAAALDEARRGSTRQPFG